MKKVRPLRVTLWNTLMLIFICNNVIMLAMTFSLEGRLLEEHLSPVFSTWLGIAVALIASGVTNQILNDKRTERELTKQGIAFGRVQEYVKTQCGWTEEELQDNIEKVEGLKRLEDKIRSGLKLS